MQSTKIIKGFHGKCNKYKVMEKEFHSKCNSKIKCNGAGIPQ